MPTKRLTLDLNTHKMKVNGWKRIFHANGSRERKQDCIFILDKIHKTKCYKRRVLHNDKRSIQQEDIILVNISHST